MVLLFLVCQVFLKHEQRLLETHLWFFFFIMPKQMGKVVCFLKHLHEKEKCLKLTNHVLNSRYVQTRVCSYSLANLYEIRLCQLPKDNL